MDLETLEKRNKMWVICMLPEYDQCDAASWYPVFLTNVIIGVTLWQWILSL